MTPDERQAVERLRASVGRTVAKYSGEASAFTADIAMLLRLVEQRPTVDREKLTRWLCEYFDMTHGTRHLACQMHRDQATDLIAAMDWRDAGELKKAEADITSLLGVASRSKKRADRLRGVVAAVEALCEAPRWSGHEIPWGWVTVDELRQAIAAAQPQAADTCQADADGVGF